MILLGIHPDNGLPICAIRSPFGPYIQCGDATEANPRPVGSWLPSCLDVTDVSLETAIQLLTFPRVLGRHPITGADVKIQLRQSGAVVRSEVIIDGTQRHAVTRLEPENEVLSFTLDRAVQLLNRVGKR